MIKGQRPSIWNTIRHPYLSRLFDRNDSAGRNLYMSNGSVMNRLFPVKTMARNDCRGVVVIDGVKDLYYGEELGD